jgi:hypothetical protein
VSKPIDSTPVSEAVDHHAAVVRHHDDGLAAAVTDALQRIGKRLADVAILVCQHDRDANGAHMVKLQLDIRVQHAAVSRFDQAQRRCDRRAALGRYLLS